MRNGPNAALISWMTEHNVKCRELADLLNTAVGDLTGKPGTMSDVTVRKWRSGETTWPQGLTRAALTRVTGKTAPALGFAPPNRRTRTTEEDSVRRRTFFASTTGTAAAIAVPALTAARPRVGTADVIRLRDGLDQLMTLDAERGGHRALEKAALAGASEAIGLQERSATQSTRQKLFSIAADYTATAAWSCIDARDLDGARTHLTAALHLAGLAQDSTAQMRVWNSTAMLARQRGDHAEAVCAAQAAQATSVSRRDPMYLSLAHARAAIGHADSHDRQQALRSLGYAELALTKADTAAGRPSWIAFYGPAELYAITAIVRDRIGDPAEAEAASHRALATLPEPFRRNRAMATTRLSLAQLHQGDIEQACHTTRAVFQIMDGSPLPGRTRSLLGDFYRDLITRAPSTTAAREWADQYRLEWSQP
ncbi:XRE family transcriptional regulator [Streptomyces violascens]|uniref:XRE family transcriptional regulator n=1 Tax=Streptomyces violascens TaxID=67381 RepID=UPI0036AB5FF8